VPLHDGWNLRACGNRRIHRAGTFRCGEAAAGLHGANRLGGNSLSDLLVFGRRAGLAAAAYAKRSSTTSIDNAQIDKGEKELLAPFSNSGTESPYAVHRDLQEVMQNLVGIFRTDEDLKKALAELTKLKTRAAKVSVEGSRLFNPGWHLSYDLKAMLIVSEAVTHSALARAESRGAHSRIDHPNTDPVWEKKNNIIVLRRRPDETPRISCRRDARGPETDFGAGLRRAARVGAHRCRKQHFAFFAAIRMAANR